MKLNIKTKNYKKFGRHWAKFFKKSAFEIRSLTTEPNRENNLGNLKQITYPLAAYNENILKAFSYGVNYYVHKVPIIQINFL